MIYKISTNKNISVSDNTFGYRAIQKLKEKIKRFNKLNRDAGIPELNFLGERYY